MSLIEEAKELFGEMRDATPEEQECIENYLKDISTPTGVNIFDLIKGEGLNGQQDGKYPKCYNPEKDNPYPLCVGNGGEMCEECCWYVDLKSPYDEEIIDVVIE